MSASAGAAGLLAAPPLPASAGAIPELVLPALLVRGRDLPWPEIVSVYVPGRPTVAFSARDLRSPGISEASRVAVDAGFAVVVRSTGGRMVAYDSGAVVIDHVSRDTQRVRDVRERFAGAAARHVQLLGTLGATGARAGEVDGEYCPGEFSINIDGRAKVVGAAQRVTGSGSLFSTVVQVSVTVAVRDVIVHVSRALGYPLRESSIAGLDDFVPGLTPAQVAAAFEADHRSRDGVEPGQLPPWVQAHALGARRDPGTQQPFHVDDWARAHPLRPPK